MTALPSMLLWIIGGLLLVASWKDLTTYRIPNWITVAILALFPVFVAAGGVPPDRLLGHGLAFVVTLGAGFALFAWGKLGGGDVKLFAALACWAGWGPPLVYLVVLTALFGGLLSLLILLCCWPPLGIMAGNILRAYGWDLAVFDPAKKAVPYGLAITAAGFTLPFLPT